MEARAPYSPAAPKVPRNLAQPITAWLREQGFTVTEQQYEGLATVGATWVSPRGDQFELAYIWVARYASATLQLQVRRVGQPADKLFGAQHVRRLRDVRLLLTGNVCYANARLLGTPTPRL
jgi:hypothetical protein